jgi:hypothetical protein
LLVPIYDLADLDSALSANREPNSAIIFPPNIFTSGKIAEIIPLVAKQKLPAVYAVPTFASLGGLLVSLPETQIG